MKFTHFLKDLDINDVDIAGGKGASLGEMLNADIPVPGGFVVKSDTFDYFIQKTGLDIQIQSLLDKVDHKTISSVEEASESIQSLILSFPMPIEIEQEIYTSFDVEQLEYIAVRSSATAEDGAEHARAGQLDSFLNTTRKDLIEKIRKCWASLFTPRAIFYRFEKDLHRDHISVAVVVQKMVQSEMSGIAFSVHPVTEDRNQIIIEAGYGLGEAIVSGAVTPDSYVVRKDTKDIDITVNHQQKALYKSQHGGNEWRNLGEQGEGQILTKDQILELSDIILHIERHYGFPCDIERAYEGGKFYIVQSRPITTLSEEIFEDASGDEIIIPSNITHDLLSSKDRYSKSYAGYTRGIVQQGMAISYASKYIGEAMSYGMLVVNRTRECHWEWFWNNNLLITKRKELLLKNRDTIDRSLNFLKDYKTKFESYVEYISSYTIEQLITLPRSELSGFLQKAYDLYIEHASMGYVADLFLSSDEKDRLEQSIENGIGDNITAEIIGILTAPTYESFVHEAEVEKLLIAYMIKSGKDVSKNLSTFVSKWLWLKTNYRDYEDISYDEIYKECLQVAESFHTLEEIQEKVKEEQHRIENNKAQKKEIYEKYGIDLGLQHTIAVSEIFTHIQDIRKSGVLRTNYLFFHILHHFSRVYNIEERYIYSLIPSELRSLIEDNSVDREEVKERYRRGSIYLFYDNEYKIIKLDDSRIKNYINLENFYPSLDNQTSLRGTVAFPGHVKGRVRILRNTTDIKQFQEGEVLVSNQTTPEFVPAMKKALAIVTDQGGITAHAAIVARELKKPCIIGTKIGTQILKDGDLVEVDADNGILHILSKEDRSSLVFKENRQKYLDREQSPFLSMSFDIPYGSLLKTVTGFGFTKQLSYYKNKITTFYKLADELAEADNFFSNILIHQQDIILEWIEKEHQTHQRFELLQSENDINKWMSLYYDILLYNTVIPYRLLSAINSNPNILAYIGEELYDALQKCRETSIYPEIMRTLFPFLCKKLCPHIDTDLCYLLSPRELVAIAGGDQSITNHLLIKRRSGIYCYFDRNQHLYNYQSNDILQLDDNFQTIQGKCAFPGKVIGKVRIINNYNSEQLFIDGEILVSINTSPDIMSYIHKAAAIISDEGGMMCHAAIISRELKIPCVVGTRIATKVLKDGDVVEVDADNGTVEIIGPYEPIPEFIYHVDLLGSRPSNIQRDECLKLFMYKYNNTEFVTIPLDHTNRGYYYEKEKFHTYLEEWKNNLLFDEGYTKYLFEYEKLKLSVSQFIVQDNLSKDDIQQKFYERYELVSSMAPYIMCSVGTEDFLDPFCRDLLQQYYPDKLDDIFDAISNPIELTEYQMMMKKIYEIKLGLYQHSLSQLVNDYYRYPEYRFTEELYTEQYFQDILDNLTLKSAQHEYDELIAGLLENKKRFLKTVESLQDHPDIQHLVQVINTNIWLRTDRVDTFKKGQPQIRKLYGQIVSFLHQEGQLNYNYDDILWMTNDEIHNYLNYNDIVSYDILQQRKTNECVMIYDGKRVYVDLDKENIQSIKNIILGEDTSEIKGMISYSGKAQGRVQIVRSREDLPLVMEGDILVAKTTFVEYTPAMKVAGAIVTDEGGITSHAAIVSRELKKPCVVGCKKAVDILHTGDIVEVDANNGIVTLLKSVK